VKTIRVKRVAAVGTAVLAGAVLAACGGGDSGGGSGGNSSEPIEIAYTGPLTGDAGQWGQDQLAGLQLLVEQINDGGGIESGPNKGRELKLSSYDDAGDPNQGASIAQKLCDNENLLAVFGPVNSSVALAASPIYNRCGLPMITSYASNPEVTLKGFDNVFRTIPNDDQLAEADVAVAAQIAGAKTIAVAWQNDAYGQGLWAGVQAAVDKYDIEIVGDASFTPEATKDFSSILDNLEQKNPDALLFMTNYSPAALLTQQARQLGIEATIICPLATAVPPYLELAGDAAEGMLTPTLYDPSSKDPKIVQFIDDYTKKFNKDPGESSATVYASGQVFEWALTQGDATREEVIKQLDEGENIETLFGTITFDKNHDPETLGGLQVLTVKNGQFVAADQQLSQ
jgi:branched-chain amino acid transport system substrate-binding protein